MTLYIIANIISFVCAFFGFIYGVTKFFKPNKAVYAQMITLAVGCMAFGRLYQVVRLLTGGNIIDEFQLGYLGNIGCLMFFFSANYGLMDSLADDGSKKYIKYRIIPIAAPAVIILICVLYALIGETSTLTKIMGALITLFAIQSSYFNLKHLIFPDVEYGIIKCLKAYNLLALIYSIICVVEVIAVNRDNGITVLITGILTGIILVCILPSVERGINKWTI